jgi:hypothetical protein
MYQYKLERSHIVSLERLLHMEYTLRELADELGCSKRKLRTAVEAGCPHHRRESRIYVRGDEFRDWYRALCQRRRRPLGPNEAFCLGCKRAVPLPADVDVYPLPNGVERATGPCPVCGSTIQRFRKAVTP